MVHSLTQDVMHFTAQLPDVDAQYVMEASRIGSDMEKTSQDCHPQFYG